MSLLGCSEGGDDVRAANPNRPSQPESAAASDPATPAELVDRAGNLWGEQRYAEALTLVERAIELAGENEDLVEFRCDLLFKLERGPELLEATMRLEEISTRKTPWLFLKIADAHLFMGETNLTLDWIEKAVRERNFTKFSVFAADRYDPIRSDPRFVAILAEIRDGLGLGLPARSFAVELIDGSELALADLAGEVVLIDFWATWCPPCLKELPDLERLYGDYHQRGFEIIGISLDEGNGVDRAHEFLAERNLPWKLALSGRGYEDEIAKLYEVSGLPSTWLIDRNGTLRHVEIHGEELRLAVEALL
jgi:peroxiredoxin